MPELISVKLQTCHQKQKQQSVEHITIFKEEKHMSYAVIQNAITEATQEQFPDGLITKVGNDSYPTIEDARGMWHSQCLSLKNDAGTLCYKCVVVDSQLNIVDNLSEFKDKRIAQPEPTPEPTPEPEEE
jgi:hypothetical protein